MAVSLQRLHFHDVATMKAAVADIAITQLQDSTEYAPLETRSGTMKAQDVILERGSCEEQLRTSHKGFEDELGSDIAGVQSREVPRGTTEARSPVVESFDAESASNRTHLHRRQEDRAWFLERRRCR